MHVVILILYSFIIWFSAIAYCLITNDHRLGYVILGGPVIISTSVAVLAGLDYGLWMARSRRRRIRAERRRVA